MDSNTQRPFITTGEIVRIANVHPNTVAMWRLTKKIEKVDQIGASFLYDRDSVMSFLQKRASKHKIRNTNKND